MKPTPQEPSQNELRKRHAILAERLRRQHIRAMTGDQMLDWLNRHPNDVTYAQGYLGTKGTWGWNKKLQSGTRIFCTTRNLVAAIRKAAVQK